MSTYAHGSTELREHAKAAKALSGLLADQRALAEQVAKAAPADKETFVEAAAALSRAVANARAAEYAARQLYTNPFNVEKTFS